MSTMVLGGTCDLKKFYSNAFQHLSIGRRRAKMKMATYVGVLARVLRFRTRSK